jgi:hypothetical protein
MSYGDGSLRAAPLGGGPPITIAAGLEGVFSLGAHGGDAYFGTWSQTSSTDRVGRASIDAPGSTTLSEGYEAITAVTADDGGVTWAATVGNVGIYRLDTGAGQPSTLETSIAPTQLAVTDTDVYFTSFGAGQIARVAKTGGPPTILASGQAAPWGIAVAGTRLVWANSGGGTIVECATDGTGLHSLASGLDGPNSVAIEGEDVYFTLKTGGAIMRLRGGVASRIADDPGGPQTILVRDHVLYWVDQGGTVFRLAL